MNQNQIKLKKYNKILKPIINLELEAVTLTSSPKDIVINGEIVKVLKLINIIIAKRESKQQKYK